METAFIDTIQGLRGHLEALQRARIIGVDIETTGLDAHMDRIRLIQLAAQGLPVLVVDCFAILPKGLPVLREALETKAVKVFQNAKFDLQFLMALGIYPTPVFDTMLAAQLLYMPGMPRRANLQTLAELYLDETLDKEEQRSDWSGRLTPSQIEYAARDADILLRLREAMIPHLSQAGLMDIAAIEFQCARAVAAMEYEGIALDVDKWSRLRTETEAARDAALEALYPYTGRPMAQTTLWGTEEVLDLNLDSNAYVAKLLNRHGIPVAATAKQDLYPYRAHPLVQALTAYRKASKALSTFLIGTPSMIHPATHRLHPRYGQITAYSGRMSCGNPNIQQIPREKAFRECFVAAPGRRLVIADYAQIELRVAAQMSEDSRMLAAYRAGEDLHALTASLVAGKAMSEVTPRERQAAKAVNFGLIYGMGAAGLQQYAQLSYGVEMTLEEATRFRQRFFQAYTGIAAWHARLKANPPREGRTLTGRRFPVSEAPSLPEMANAPVQGTAADIIKLALGMLAGQVLGSDIHIVGVVHDEILLEAPTGSDAPALLSQIMEEAAARVLPRVPSPVEACACRSWAEK